MPSSLEDPPLGLVGIPSVLDDMLKSLTQLRNATSGFPDDKLQEASIYLNISQQMLNRASCVVDGVKGMEEGISVKMEESHEIECTGNR